MDVVATSTDRLSCLDASFLQLEAASPTAHMHVGGVLVFSGTAPAYEELCAAIARRLHLVPRYRQRLHTVPADLANPRWIDDPHFRLERHVHTAAVPSPGSEAQLSELVSRIFSERLHRDRPLWELWLVQGLDQDRFALISKMHHCLSDGISGVDIATVLFDLERTPPDADASPKPWRPRPVPTIAETLGAAAVDSARRSFRAARTATSIARHRREWRPAVRLARSAAGQLGQGIRGGAPASPYNIEIGTSRRFTWVHASLSEIKAIKSALGGTVNDVVLAAVAGAMHRHLDRQRAPAAHRDLIAMVPVNLRTEAEHGTLGNRIAVMFIPLPVGEADPVNRLHTVGSTMRRFKGGDQAAGVDLLARLGDLVPPRMSSGLAHLAASARVFNVTVTNIPGPQVSLYLLGRQLQYLVPMVPIAAKHALGIAAMSYNGRVSFGLLGDDVVMEDIEELGRDFCSALRELADAAGTSMAITALAEAPSTRSRELAGSRAPQMRGGSNGAPRRSKRRTETATIR